MTMLIISLISVFFSLTAVGYSDTPPANLWRGLIAENTTATDREWTAMACVVRNRQAIGWPHGLCGLKRKSLIRFTDSEIRYATTYGRQIDRITQDIVDKVYSGKQPDVTGGAVYFENVEKYGKPRWYNGKTAKRFGKHTFWK